MVKFPSFRRFTSDTAGVVMVEAMISIPILIMILVTMVEFGVATFQWNQSIKALQIGARLASVSSPIVTDTDYATLSDFGALIDGDPVPTSVVSVSCGAGTNPCNAAQFNRLYFGSDGVCGSPAPGAVSGMCDTAPFLGPDVIRVTYTRAGLGYVGRPFGPVATITVELHNMSFDLLILDDLFSWAGSISIPAHPVSITSEDVSNCKAGC